jgi:polyhydroxyalkanoate synthesis regulator phasin
MERPDIDGIEKELKRGTGYRRMQGTALQLILWIRKLEADVEEVVSDYMSLGEDFGEALEQIDDLEQEVRDLREEKKRRE